LQSDVYNPRYYISDLDNLIAKLDLQVGLNNNIYAIRLLEKKIMTCRWRQDNEANALILCDKVEKTYIMMNLLETKEYGLFLMDRSEIYKSYGNLILCLHDLQKAREILSRQENNTYADVYRYQYPIVKYYMKINNYDSAEAECIKLISIYEDKNSNYNADYFSLISLLATYIYFENMQYDKAIARCNDAIKKLESDESSQFKAMIDLRIIIGKAYIEKKDYKKAAKSLKSAMDILERMLACERYESNILLYNLMYFYRINKLIATAHYEGGFFNSAAKVLKLLLNDDHFKKNNACYEKYKKMFEHANELSKRK
jgi:tetratricopeptide (TPR) repeat protein